MDELAVACGIDPIELRIRNEPTADPRPMRRSAAATSSPASARGPTLRLDGSGPHPGRAPTGARPFAVRAISPVRPGALMLMGPEGPLRRLAVGSWHEAMVGVWLPKPSVARLVKAQARVEAYGRGRPVADPKLHPVLRDGGERHGR